MIFEIRYFAFYFRQSRNRHRAKVSNIADEWRRRYWRSRRRSRRCGQLLHQQWRQLWHRTVDRSQWRCLATGRHIVYDKGATSGLRTGHGTAAGTAGTIKHRRTTATTAAAAAWLWEVSMTRPIAEKGCQGALRDCCLPLFISGAHRKLA